MKHNGVTIHDNVEITDKTGGGQAEGPTPGALSCRITATPCSTATSGSSIAAAPAGQFPIVAKAPAANPAPAPAKSEVAPEKKPGEESGKAAEAKPAS